jgi:hypothetical protein
VRAQILIAAASLIASITVLQTPADAQVRVARPRTVAVRPVVVSRPTVFVGGYYYPTLYRGSLWYNPWGPSYYGGYHGAPYYYQYPIYGPGRSYYGMGSVRVEVKPRNAEVFVDGYFAGTVDDFDGVFQRLNMEPGDHEIVIYLEGHRSFSQRFYLQPGRSFNIRHTMQPLGAGETAPSRPQGAPIQGRGADAPYDDRRPVPPDARGPGAGRGTGGGRGRQGGPAAPEGFGSLSLRVQPADAQVLIDGEVWQGSPDSDRLVIQLGAGTHNVEIRKDGYRSYLTDIPISNGQVRTLNVALTKQ